MSQNQSEFIRRKFTITEALDETLVDIADHHYQGNVSLCIRAAIEDHRRALEGNNDVHSVNRLQTDLERLRESQEALIDTVDDLKQKASSEDRNETPSTNSADCIDNRFGEVRETIHSAEGTVRLEDLQEELGWEMSRLQPLLGRMVDAGVIVRTGQTPPRFRLAGRNTENCNEY